LLSDKNFEKLQTIIQFYHKIQRIKFLLFENFNISTQNKIRGKKKQDHRVKKYRVQWENDKKL